MAIGSLVAFALTLGGTPAVDGKAAFEKLKALAGDWQGTIDTETGPPGAVRYEVGSNGTIVRELMFPGNEREMMTVYHLVGGELVATHYCAMGNQPRMKLASGGSTELVFAFDGGTNFVPERDPHVHSGRISIKAPDRLEAEWAFFDRGKQAGIHRFFLRRKE